MSLARTLILAHRYLGIAVGLLMAVWCLSGTVMMYVPYPRLTEAERVQHLAPIAWAQCCASESALATVAGTVSGFQLEMVGIEAVLRLTIGPRKVRIIDLATASVAAVPPDGAARIAAAYSAAKGALPRLLERVNYDQWTVQGNHDLDRPLFHFALNDERGTELYVSTVTGKAVQATTTRQRFWNWLGALPHWLYFTPLRAHGELWSQVVIWTSMLGTFLTVTGIYVGLKQLKRRSSGRWIPYSGFQYWHHALGVCFGLFVLTWVVSGLISMNPWGFLEGGGFDEPGRLRGSPLPASTVAAGLDALAHASLSQQAVQVESAPLRGRLFMIVTRSGGERIRVDEHANPTPLSADELQSIAGILDSRGEGYAMKRLEQEDEYYFSHHRERARLPAYRVIVHDSGLTRYYLDCVSGEILQKMDRDNQWYRWLHEAPHRFDFSAAMRSRPLWDLLTLLLLGGATAVCAIGAYLGVRRVTS